MGEVVTRAPENVNPNLPTGEIEIAVRALERLASSETPPFPIDEDVEVDEMLRLQHRALDLRRDAMARTMALRHQIVKTMRDVLDERDFLEIETPILTRSTPGGRARLPRAQPPAARRVVRAAAVAAAVQAAADDGGYERYFQIARCFRDEDLRADRQPEFTQLDLEMSFVDEDDVIETMEAVMAAVFAAAGFDAAAAAVARAWPSTTRCCATAPTSPIRASTFRSRRPTRCGAASSRSSSRCSAPAA